MVPILPGQRVVSQLDVLLFPLIRGLATLFIAALGMMLFGMVGSLAYPVGGVGAIIGSVMGVIICLLLGCCVTGFWKDFVPDDTKTFGIRAFLPHVLAVQIGTHGNFDLIVTVHQAVGIEVQGHMPWKRSDTFIEIECGNNPVKRTCVRNDGKFNEQFKLQVAAADEGILLRIKDQDVFGTSDIGFVYVDIQKDIIDAGFPRRREFDVEAGENDKLRWGKNKAALLLSFDYTDDYPRVLRHDEKRQTERHQDLEQQWSSKNYGAVSFLSKLEFNPTVKIAKENAQQTKSLVTDTV